MHRFLITVLLLFSVSVGQYVWAAPPKANAQAKQNVPGEKKAKAPAAHKFVRVTKDKDGQLEALQTSIASYTMKDKAGNEVRVDLIGAVHVGEKSYYEALNKQFEKYDALLFELVAPEGTKIPKGGRDSGHPVGALQRGMKSMLKLEFQLEAVDYSKKNFVHADMTPDQFSKSMKDRGESFFKMFLRVIGHSITKGQPAGSVSEVEILLALFDKNRALKLKRLMARQFDSMEVMMEAINGPNGSTILTERNKVAIKVLKKQLAAGKKHVGVFYGAAHMPDMEKRLLTELKLKHTGDRWVSAWDLRGPAAVPAKKPAPKAKAVAP